MPAAPWPFPRTGRSAALKLSGVAAPKTLKIVVEYGVHGFERAPSATAMSPAWNCVARPAFSMTWARRLDRRTVQVRVAANADDAFAESLDDINSTSCW